MKNNVIVEIIKDSFEDSKSVAKNINIDMFELVQIAVSVYSGQLSIQSAALQLEKKYGKDAKRYIDAFTKNAIKSGFSHTDKLKKLGTNKFAKEFKVAVNEIAIALFKYVNGEIDEVQLLSEFSSSKIKVVANQMLNELGYDPQFFDINSMPKGNLALLMVSVTALAEAHKILNKAKEDALIMHEKRLIIEKQCNESIEMMKQYEIEITKLVNEYFNEHNTTISYNISLMNHAIIDNDVNGYISANVAIQELLGYDIQFTNQDEFDDLMDSDEDFVL